MPERRTRLEAARLYLVCDARPERWLEGALRGGVDIVQLRIKAAPDEEVLACARRFAGACARARALLIINDRPDLALAAEADGVHLGQDDVAVAVARATVGAGRLVGLSTHSREQVTAAAGLGVDYIGVGPVHATPTKPGRPAVGLALVAAAARESPIPFFAIGGIDAGNVAAVRAAGATRVAVVRALTEAADPERAARELRAALTRAALTATEAGSEPRPEVRVGAAQS